MSLQSIISVDKKFQTSVNLEYDVNNIDKYINKTIKAYLENDINLSVMISSAQKEISNIIKKISK